MINGKDNIIRNLNINDVDKLINLRKILFDNTEFVSYDFIVWQLNENPNGKAVNLFYYDKLNEIVGEHWFIPVRYKIFDKIHLGSIGANALVRKDYRKKNIYTILEKLSSEECIKREIKFSLFLPNSFTYNALVNKLTNEDLGEIPLLILPVNIISLVEYKYKNILLKISFTLLLKSILTFINYKKPRHIYDANITVEYSNNFDDSIDKFWDVIKHKYKCLTIRNYKYLKWRYKNLINREYKILISRFNNEIKGYLIYRITFFNKQKLCVIMDYFYESSEIGRKCGEILLHVVKKESHKENVNMVCCLMLPACQEYRTLKKFGFVKVPRKLKPHPFHLVYQYHTGLIEGNITMKNLTNWYWTFGDYDIF